MGCSLEPCDLCACLRGYLSVLHCGTVQTPQHAFIIIGMNIWDGVDGYVNVKEISNDLC